MNSLIPLQVEVQGLVKASNLEEFKAAMLDGIAAINQSLSTDAEFGQAEADVKTLESLEKSLESAKEAVMNGAADIAAIVRAVDQLKEHAGNTRRALGKLIADRKTAIREAAKQAALAKLGGAVPPQVAAKLEVAMKGKRTVATQQAAVNREADLIIEETQAVEAYVRAAGGGDGDVARLKWATMASAQAEMDRMAAMKARAKVEAEAAAQAEKQQQSLQPFSRSLDANGQIVNHSFADCFPWVSEAPVSMAEIDSPEKEWSEFKKAVFFAFANLKEPRERLQFAENQARAKAFANAANAAWREVK